MLITPTLLKVINLILSLFPSFQWSSVFSRPPETISVNVVDLLNINGQNTIVVM